MTEEYFDSKSSHKAKENKGTDYLHRQLPHQLFSCQHLRTGPVTKCDSHMFFPLSIGCSYLVDWAGVQSIMPGTLIKLLQQSLFPGVLSSLADIISHPENYPTVTITTLAISEFYDYSLTSYSFRVLGLLSKIPPYMVKPPQKPSLEFVFRHKICTVHTDKDPVTQKFQENWKSGWSIDLKKFIIILFIEKFSAVLQPSYKHDRSFLITCSQMQ